MRAVFLGAASLTAACLFVSGRPPARAAEAPPARPSPSGALLVSTLPSGADVYVDGIYVGRSPVLVDALGVGRHGVTMTRAGWTLREVEAVVTNGGVTFEDERLGGTGSDDDGGMLRLRGLPDDARVTLDGVAIATGVPVGAASGRHVLAITTATTHTTRTITLFPGVTTEVLARDASVVTAPASAAVVAPLDEWLPDAELRITGKNIRIRYEGHRLDARLGDGTVRVDGALETYVGSPAEIAGKLYLPLGLLERLAGTTARPDGNK